MSPGAEPPIFRAFHRDQCVAEAPLDGAEAEAAQAVLSESQYLTFEVEPPEPGLQYRIVIGDIAPDNAVASRSRRYVEWQSAQYLESARGLVPIRLQSRAEEDGDARWRHRAELLVAVNSSKLTEAAFEAMVEDLTALSSGLLFDLLSKARTGLVRAGAAPEGKASPRSAQLELSFLEELTDTLPTVLLQISMHPWIGVRSQRVIGPWTGSESLSPDAVSWFLARGLDPRQAGVGNEMLGPRLQVVPESNSPEHGTIRWFLDLLEQRALECAHRARSERASLEADKPYRDRRFGGEPSLFERFDQPKIEQLTEAGARAARIMRSVRGMRKLPFLRGQRAVAPVEQTAVFRNVEGYHQFWRLMREYLRRTTVLLEHSLAERSKPTWRMYEQWVFLQLAAACEAIGLRPSSHESLFKRLGAHLFTVDLRRGTRLGFTASDGRVVLLRYEPWIFSRDIARRNGDPVFQGRDGEVPWSPDVLIEVFEPAAPDKPPALALAIVLDAKYSRRLEERHWEDTGKYQMIRGTDSGAQVVRQVWLALPVAFDEGPVVFRDQSVAWTDDGPDRPFGASEFFQGAVSLIPDPDLPRGSLAPGAKLLMSGILSWLGFREAATHRQQVALDSAA